MSKSEIRQFFARIGIQLTDWQFERVYELLNPKLIKDEGNTVIGKVESVNEETGGIRITGVIHDEFAHFVKGDATHYSLIEEDDEDYEEWKRHYERYTKECEDRVRELRKTTPGYLKLERWTHRCSNGSIIGNRTLLEDKCQSCGVERP